MSSIKTSTPCGMSRWRHEVRPRQQTRHTCNRICLRLQSLFPLFYILASSVRNFQVANEETQAVAWAKLQSGHQRACLRRQSRYPLCHFLAAEEKSNARRVATSSMSIAPRFSKVEIPFLLAAKKRHRTGFWKPQKIIYGVIVFGGARRYTCCCCWPRKF